MNQDVKLTRLLYQRNAKANGFTLIELIFVLLIAGILISIAVPSYNDAVSKNKVNAPYKSLRSAISLAKTEAISRNQQVVICASDDQSSCGDDWNKGWMVFVDSNKNESYEASASESGDIADEILSVNTELNSEVTLSFISNKSGKAATEMVFTRQGYATGTSGDFIFCSKHDTSNKAENARAIIVIESGVIRMSSDGDDEDLIHENSKGGNITC